MHNLKRKTSGRPPATTYDFFIGGDTKTADLAIYYNVAFDSVKKQFENKPASQRNSFLAEYLWKAHLLQKNSNGYEITSQDKRIIPELIQKVEEIRNFHSHIWHDNSVLKFSHELKQFVETKYEEAKALLYAEYPSAVTDFEYLQQTTAYKDKFNLFKNVQGEQFITIEGRIFFLSFFLTTGQMNRFLQQRKGNKRTDLPEFKIKRLIYTFYCHRDGAAITDFNQTNRFVDTMDVSERQNVFRARTAFKLISYLFDYPDYWGSTEAMPLFDADGTIVKNVLQLQQYVEDRNILPSLCFQPIERGIPINSEDEKEIENLIKAEEDKHRTGTIAFTIEGITDYTFHINFQTFHRLVLLQLLKGNLETDYTPLEVLKDQLKKQSQNRAAIYSILIKSPQNRTAEEHDYLLEKEHQFLRGGRDLTEKGIIFFESLEKRAGEKENDTLLLANCLRGKHQKWFEIIRKNGYEISEVEPEAIQVYQQDFVLGTRQKFRAGNRFVFYAAKYLMDFAGDGWYWGMEKFVMAKVTANAANETLIKKKTYFKASEIPLSEDYRLTIENDHVYIAMVKNPEAQSNHEKFHQFALGPKALRYLATFIQKNEQSSPTDITNFLAVLCNDLNILHTAGKWQESDHYTLLEKPFISEYLKSSENHLERLKQRFTSRIDFIKNEWDKALANKMYLSRSAKNKLIMGAYRLFDWASEERPDGKFLRANEYNQMSVCHYSLHLKKSLKDKPAKFDYLFQKLFKLEKRQPPIPTQIKNYLDFAQSLDDLLELVIEDRKSFLDNKLSLPSKLLRKELPALCRKLGISIPVELLKDSEQEALKSRHATTLEVQTFMIHPMLLLKRFFPKEYEAGKVMTGAADKNGVIIKKRPQISLFVDLRKNERLSDTLHAEFYTEAIPSLLYPIDQQKKQREKLCGLLHITHTEDILLWWMAQRYLRNNDFTKELGEIVNKTKGVTLATLNNLTIQLPLKAKPDDSINETLHTSILMHQLDDMMFLTEKKRLRKAAVHFLRRCTIEKDSWNNDLQILSENQFDGKALPNGQKATPLPFRLLRDEQELVRRHGQKLADYILTFEKDTLQRILEEKYKGNKEKMHNWLTSIFTKGDSQKLHFNFESVLNSTPNSFSSDYTLLSDYRNITFHNDIPTSQNGTFAWITRQGEPLRRMLHITEDITARKDGSEYKIDNGQST